MNSFDLSFLKYLQEHSPVLISEATVRFGKTLSTLKRTMKEINELLPDEYYLHLDNQFITTRMEYRAYIEFLEKITFNRYLTNSEERISDLLVGLCLHDIVNKSEYYKKFHVSAGTIKNDNPTLAKYLDSRNLSVNSVHRLGTTLCGDEIQLRIAVCMTILKTVEIGEDNILVIHKANEPVNRAIASQFLQTCGPEIERAAAYYNQEIATRLSLGYNGKKYFLVYMSIALHRIGRRHILQNVSSLAFITAMNFSLLDDEQENRFLDLLVSSLTFTWRPFTIYDSQLVALVRDFFHNIAPALQATIHNQSSFFAEIYQFIYTSIVQNKFHLWFDDKKLHEVQEHYPALYQAACDAIKNIEQGYQVSFSSTHIATLILILKKYELQNRLQDEQKKRIVIVTNSSESKVGYFKEVIKAWFHVEIIACININELHQLSGMPFDLLLTFTNKISSYLRYYQLDYIKVNFHLSPEDISLLRKHGLSRAKKKIAVEHFMQKCDGVTGSDLRRLLETHYPEIFI
ncbi:PRD domain-containing protein [Buttiauxella gaviniae]|uniref:PRD domain-containing protein n=1 Tax=Buttiauxella gaviniae TaxID=82990 RepID=UPI003C72F385